MVRVYAFLAWFHICLAMVLGTVAALVVPETAFAQTTSCSDGCKLTCLGPQGERMQPCYTDCMAKCCAGCGTDKACVDDCSNNFRTDCSTECTAHTVGSEGWNNCMSECLQRGIDPCEKAKCFCKTFPPCPCPGDVVPACDTYLCGCDKGILLCRMPCKMNNRKP